MTSNDGNLSINWQEVLAVFSAKVSGASDGEQVASLTDAQVNILRDILWEMNDVSYSTHTESHEVEVTTTNDDGEEETTTETVTETVLTITITHKTAAEMAGEYHFNSRQNEYLALMMQPDNQNLWAQLLGGACVRRRANHHPGHRLGAYWLIGVAAAAKLHNHISLWLPRRPVHWRDRIPQRYRHRSPQWDPNPGGCSRHSDHRQRHRLLGRWLRIPHQDRSWQRAGDSLCALFGYLCDSRTAGAAGRGDRICWKYR